MTDPVSERTVTATVEIPEGLPQGAAVLHVRVEDVSVADRSATVLATEDVSIDDVAVGGTVQVELTVPAGAVDERASYAVFAHLDVGCTGEVKVGDALTTQVNPALTHGAPDDVSLTLTVI